jgi:FkbM family methyltransferase
MRDWRGYISVGEKYIEIMEEFGDSIGLMCEVGTHFWRDCRLVKEIIEGKEVMLVEALPQCVADLKYHCLNRGNVTIHEVAVADYSGKEKFYTDDLLASFSESVMIENVDSVLKCPIRNGFTEFDQVIEVDAIKFSEIDAGNIDVLLADCEGSEVHLLNHLVSRPKMIYVESEPTDFTKPKKDELHKWFKENGYIFVQHDDNDDLFIRPDFLEKVEERFGKNYCNELA